MKQGTITETRAWTTSDGASFTEEKEALIHAADIRMHELLAEFWVMNHTFDLNSDEIVDGARHTVDSIVVVDRAHDIHLANLIYVLEGMAKGREDHETITAEELVTLILTKQGL